MVPIDFPAAGTTAGSGPQLCDFLYLMLGLAAISLLYVWRRLTMLSRESAFLRAHVAQRQRIADELHDGLLQSVQGLMLGVEATLYEFPEHALVQSHLERMLGQARATIAEARNKVRDLRNHDQAGAFAEALAEIANQVLSASSPGVQVTVEGTPRPLDTQVFDELRRIVAEAIYNVERHANAGRVEIAISFGRRALFLRIVDDGAGMDQCAVDGDGRAGHHGLRGIHARTHKVGGRLTVESLPGSGTLIEIVVPGRRAYAGR